MPDSSEFPVWMYWENLPGKQMPTYLKMCAEIAESRLSGRFQIVGPEEINNLLGEIDIDFSKIRMSDPNRNNLALKVDYYRVALLQKFGGLWLDVDCIVRRDIIPEIQSKLNEYDFWGMKKTETIKKVTNNIMASRPNGVVITNYKNEIDAKIREKIKNDELFEWTEIGADLLTPIVENHSNKCHLEAEEKLHPIHFKDFESFWVRRDDHIKFEPRVEDSDVVMLYNALFTSEQKKLTRRQILNHNSLIGALMREGLPSQVKRSTPSIKSEDDATNLKKSDVTIIFTTTKRPQCCLDFVKSIRKQLGYDLKINIAAQGKYEPEYKTIEDKYKAKIFLVEEDAGLSYSRNLLVKETKEPIVFLCDDDFVFDNRLNLDRALEVLNERPEISIIGGMFENYDYRNGKVNSIIPTSFAHFIKNHEGRLTFFPAVYIENSREFLDECAFVAKVETVNNFALIRREVFTDHGISWLDDIKIMGEHEHFYYQVSKLSEKIGVYYTNLLITQHHRKTNPEFSTLRGRLDGLATSMAAIGVKFFLFPGKRTDAALNDHKAIRLQHSNWELEL